MKLFIMMRQLVRKVGASYRIRTREPLNTDLLNVILQIICKNIDPLIWVGTKNNVNESSSINTVKTYFWRRFMTKKNFNLRLQSVKKKKIRNDWKRVRTLHADVNGANFYPILFVQALKPILSNLQINIKKFFFDNYYYYDVCKLKEPNRYSLNRFGHSILLEANQYLSKVGPKYHVIRTNSKVKSPRGILKSSLIPLDHPTKMN